MRWDHIMITAREEVIPSMIPMQSNHLRGSVVGKKNKNCVP